ncbi:MAG: MobC family plasmid mobilization relaxosome protein [Zoogloeaceae bacterium]|nr:MobC family plasmid mobilization relaxosome protein [Zoogloeaceae bacterium]
MPRTALEKITVQADNCLTPRNHYLAGLILAHIGQAQLRGDEIETLRRSNYELSKIGNNLNQIAKAFNILVNGERGKMPEIGKKLASLRREIVEHTGHVLRVLNSGSAFWEVKQGRGQKPRKTQ